MSDTDKTLPERINAKLTYQDIALVLNLDAAGKTQTEIAAVVGVGQSQISRLLAEFGDTRGVAKQRLHASADQIAKSAMVASEVAAKRGDGSVALELLDRMDVAPKKREGSNRGAQVVVMVGGSNPAALPDFSVVEHV